ncbi:MAG: 23S rRNA (guanosine(2251)-2'-O)-methyltransferase RlmB [Chloroflexota bacterium]|nr:23S rRNA (guanosine(2251)-2'-O)-methyltransferase RlmB [Anaerolineae bacterium]
MKETLYGRNTVIEALRANRRRFYQISLSDGIRPNDVVSRIFSTCQKRGIRMERMPRRMLDEVCGHDRHQGVLASVSSYPDVEIADVLSSLEASSEQPLLLLLDGLQDPQNLGTLLRAAEAIGVHGVVIPRRRSAQITPAVSKASSGAVEHLMIAGVSNLNQAIRSLKEAGVWVVGLEDVPEAQHYRDADLDRSLALVVGSEGKGLSRLVRERCDFLIKLPMSGRVASLNAAVAGSIALYEVWEQRHPAPSRREG